MAILYQFSGSHFCEKARWALDFKGVDYRVVNLVPGPHRRTVRRFAPATSLPVFVDDGQAIQGSGAIMDYLDKRVRRPPLTPTDTQDSAMALEWERYLDRNIGVNLRLFFYFHAFENRRFASDFLLRDAPAWGRPYLWLTYPFVKRAMLKSMSINAANAGRAREQFLHAADRLDERVASNRYLAGPFFSRADLTAAALLFHQWDDSWTAPPAFAELMVEVSERPFYRWAEAIYEKHRRA